ncbi:N-acetylmuramoyl-L-alanine amidase [Streptococcus dysgalactiae subsp. dysgalactiae]|uniref:K07273 lysozyme n=1 Tax=Streptococcus dysgalactiae subsp. equisimilis AC-2713 TaxID=759913 RepID=A0AB33R414_STREQ|nr:MULTISPECIES: glycoside hydrolase family 25 protein [Streptococcus]EGR87536.1 glycosyl hydrolase family 25 [Streptococcus dysgalactiae subsp. equisimilis SK1250]KKC17600.1 N-acetylmuramoyl-L-alanine amidase [Streptococcus dysgalactiae subsp. equisimilis]KKC19979.1 N-acetylmuramoyl-L-alanine amidase [Streptococcus dysgalactiae subsp. equisimilis]MBM6514616.1 glycoside hydrolase family 25 protein [Streptococcus dysgalactiae subsp. equisimilis]MBM6540988.1 glycoside hydrolase family 25 protein
MRRRIKPIVVLVFFALLAMVLIIGKLHANQVKQKELEQAKANIPIATSSSTKTSTSETEDFVLNPIIDVSGWQLPEEIDYDTLSHNISGAIVRVYGGSQITAHNNAAFTTGIDKSFKKHIKEFQKRDVPVAVYSYALGRSAKEMREEARAFYKNAAPFNPTYYWIDVEEVTMKDMNKGVKAFREELKKLGAENIGLYIGTYFMAEQEISTKGFDAIWIPTYGSDSGYYEAAPNTTLDYDLHQYTSQGYINGFNHPLDLNQIAVTKDTKKTFEKLFGKIKN